MAYKLNEKIYLVNGAKKHCIYDLENNRLYSINQNTYDFIKRILTNDSLLFVTKEERELIDTLISNHIIRESINIEPIREINELIVSKDISFAWFEVTQRCNLRCIHCYEDAQTTNSTDIDITNFFYAADEVESIGVKSIQFIGGEPLLIGDKLKKMIIYCKNKFRSIEVFTNGTLINPEWVKFFNKFKIKVALSVYSYESQQHDKITKVNGSWEKTNKAIELLKIANIPYRVCRVKMKDVKVGELNTSLYDINRKRDLVRLTGRANISLYDNQMLMEKIIQKKTFFKPIKKDMVQRIISGHNCFSTKLYIDTNLDVYPCVMERRFLHGNLKENPLGKIISKEIVNLNKDKIKVCQKCEYRYACFDCRADSMGRNKYDKPWYCSYDPEKGEWVDINKFIDNLL